MARGSSSWWIRHYGKPCLQTDIVQCDWYPGLEGNQRNVHKGTEQLWKALGAIMLAYNYKVPTSYTGAYSCRPITGTTNKWSGHAWPVAMDINAKTNPYIRTPSLRTIKWGVETDMPANMVAEIESIKAAGIRAFGWGGRWRSIKDAMHYQVRVTLNEIQAGVIAPRGFYGGGGTAPGDDEMTLKKGDKGNAVKKVQASLNSWNDLGLEVDGIFGSGTEAAVKSYQKAANLPESGEVGGVEMALLMEYLPDRVPAPVKPHKHEATAAVSEGTKVSVEIGESA